jgi:hypothetical protein
MLDLTDGQEQSEGMLQGPATEFPPMVGEQVLDLDPGSPRTRAARDCGARQPLAWAFSRHRKYLCRDAAWTNPAPNGS